jgi:hypothetical protein
LVALKLPAPRRRPPRRMGSPRAYAGAFRVLLDLPRDAVVLKRPPQLGDPRWIAKVDPD